MKRMSRRDFHRFAAVGAVVAPLAGISGQVLAQEQAVDNKPNAKQVLTPEQAKKVQESVAKREEKLAVMRSHTLPYGLEPAFVFRVCTPRRVATSAAKGSKD